MKERYEYIHFGRMVSETKTSMWTCFNNSNNAWLGTVKWYGPWRQYCYFPTDARAVYSAGCLKDIQDFIAQLMKQRAEARGK